MTITRSESFSRSSLPRRLSCGIKVPSKKAPNSAWMPIASVSSAEHRSATQITAKEFWFKPCPSVRRAKRWSNGRTASSMKAR